MSNVQSIGRSPYRSPQRPCHQLVCGPRGGPHSFFPCPPIEKLISNRGRMPCASVCGNPVFSSRPMHGRIDIPNASYGVETRSRREFWPIKYRGHFESRVGNYISLEVKEAASRATPGNQPAGEASYAPDVNTHNTPIMKASIVSSNPSTRAMPYLHSQGGHPIVEMPPLPTLPLLHNDFVMQQENSLSHSTLSSSSGSGRDGRDSFEIRKQLLELKALNQESSRQRKKCRTQAYPSENREATAFSPRPLGIESDEKYLTEFHCFLRQHCIEVFCANEEDVNAPRRGRKKPVQLGQVGIRCMPCARLPEKRNGAAYYPTSIASIYNSVMLIQQRHFGQCRAVSSELRNDYTRLKGILGRSGAAKDYWEVSARKMGIVDSPDGTLRFEPSEAEKPSNSENGLAAVRTACDKTSQSPLVEVADKELATNYSFLLMSQMTSCTFAESDRLGKRRSHRLGFPGIACVHCFSSNGSGRYFPSSVKTFADVSKTQNVLHNHLEKCKRCPEAIIEELSRLKDEHQAEKETKAYGSQKNFFDLIWTRLHHTTASSPSLSLSQMNSRKSPDSVGSFCITSSTNTRNSNESEGTVTFYAGMPTDKRGMDIDPAILKVAQIMTTTLSKGPGIWDTWQI